MIARPIVSGSAATARERLGSPDSLVSALLDLTATRVFALESLLSLSSIEWSDEIRTACVECVRRPRLLLNPDFVEKNCRTRERLATLILHELAHVSLGHTQLYPRGGRAHNIAFDAIINSDLSFHFARSGDAGPYTALFTSTYEATVEPEFILRPPEGWPDDPQWGISNACSDNLRTIHRRLYDPGHLDDHDKRSLQVTYGEIIAALYQSAQSAAGDDSGGVSMASLLERLLGGHGATNTERAAESGGRDETTARFEMYFNPRLTGFDLDFEMEIQRHQIERLVEPDLLTSIEICKRVLAEARKARHEVEKVLLVGGPTLMPFVRERLRAELGIELETAIDPMTVVARGAAIFGGAQRMFVPTRLSRREGRVSVHLKHEPIGSDARPALSGRIPDFQGVMPSEGSIELRLEGLTSWTSGQVPLIEGRFEMRLYARPDERNEYTLILRDAGGRTVACDPPMISYTIGAVSSRQRANAAIGIAMADGMVDIVVEQGAELPLRRATVHELALHLFSDGDRDFKVPLVEGNNQERADRNKLIGTIRLPASGLPDFLREGTRVKITVAINASGTMSAEAEVPGVGKVPCVKELEIAVPDRDDLEDGVVEARERLERLSTEAILVDDTAAWAVLQKVEEQQLVEGAESAQVSAGDDNETALLEAGERLNTLNSALDDLEGIVKRPEVIDQAKANLSKLDDIVWIHGTDEEKDQYFDLRAQLDQAEAEGTTTKIRSLADRIDKLHTSVWVRTPECTRWYFTYLRSRTHLSWAPNDAQQLVQSGETALALTEFGDESIAANALATLERVNTSLSGIIPSASGADEDDMIRGVTRRTS